MKVWVIINFDDPINIGDDPFLDQKKGDRVCAICARKTL